jgi:hypothetical protein
MNRYLVLILGITTAVLLIKYRVQIKHFVGDIGWAEKVFGVGGTHTFIVVLAGVAFFGSLMYFLGTFQTILHDYLGPLFGVK